MPSASNNNNNSNKLEKQNSNGSAGGAASSTSSTNIVAEQNAEINALSVNNNKNNNNDATNTANATPNNNTSSNTKVVVAAAATAAPTAATGGANAAIATAATANDANNPIKLSITTIEHKIRNLEKRKTKLESYRSIQDSGKELSLDQKAAVAKYEAVVASLDFARDLSKQMSQFAKDAEKEQKKQARKDNILKAHAETAKIREVLVIQSIVTCFTDESVCADFMNGENGAVKLEQSDLDAIKKFSIDTRTRRPESADDVQFLTATQKAAELLSMTIDGRPKQYGETTFENLRRIFNQIQECGYLDHIFLAPPEPISESNDDDISANAGETEETAGGEENSFDEGMEKLNLSDSVGETGVEPPQAHTFDDIGLATAKAQDTQQQQQQVVNEHIDIQQQQQQQQQQHQVNAQQLPLPQHQQQQQQQQLGLQAPLNNAGNLASFQQQQQQQQTQVAAGSAGAATTPVHVNMYPPPQLQAPPPQQLQQVVPPGGIISLAPQLVAAAPPPPATAQQRQMLNSPAAAGAQLPQGTPIQLHGAPPGAHFPPTTVRAVEHGFFKQHQQYLQQMRPLAEVIGGGNFFFLQESELDSPEMNATAGNTAPVTSVVFEQQQQQLHAQPPPPSQSNLINHQDMPKPTELLHKTPEVQQQAPHQQQHVIVNNLQQQQQSQAQQPIPTQTFTNQSFPPIQQVQAPPTVAAVAAVAAVANSSNTPTLASNTPSPMFQQKHQQLFSPVTGLQQQQHLLQQQQPQQDNNPVQQQTLLNEQQQQPMMIMQRLPAPQARLPPQQASQQQQQAMQLGMQAGDVNAVSAAPPTTQVAVNAGFPFDNPIVTTLTYEQQMQQQLAAAAALKNATNNSALDDKKKSIDDALKYSAEHATANNWEATLKNVVVRAAAESNVVLAQTNVSATAALANVLKPNTAAVAAATVAATMETGKWSSEMNALGTPTAPNTNASSNSSSNNNSSSTQSATQRKNEWSTSGGGGGGGYGDSPQTTGENAHESNHWNSNQQQDGNGGYGRGTRGPYQRRGTDERRERDDRRDERGGRGPTGGYRGRNYGNSAQSQNSGGGRGNGSGSGIYFRNNENSTGGGSSYYQNGGGANVYGGNKDSRYDAGSSGNYRGQRSNGGNNVRNNAPPRGALGRNSSGATNSTTTSTYMNPRPSNRMPMGLENKN